MSDYGDSERAMLIQDMIAAAIKDREEYNGWKNYPTWAVNLWLSNDEGLYHATQDLVRQTTADDYSDKAHCVADALKFWVTDDLAPDLGASFAADLLGWALGEVDWDEISAAWLDTANESV